MYYYVRGLFGGWRAVTQKHYERVVRHIVTSSSVPYKDKLAAIDRRTIKSDLPLTGAELKQLAAK